MSLPERNPSADVTPNLLTDVVSEPIIVRGAELTMQALIDSLGDTKGARNLARLQRVMLDPTDVDS